MQTSFPIKFSLIFSGNSIHSFYWCVDKTQPDSKVFLTRLSNEEFLIFDFYHALKISANFSPFFCIQKLDILT